MEGPMALLSFLLLALGGIVAGISLATQAAVNAHLGKALESASAAAFVSYLGGTIVMGMVLAVGSRIGFGLPPLGTAQLAGMRWWAWSGGLLGSIYVMISILLVPRLGTATVLSLFVLGQMLASVAFDNFGLFGLAVRSADLGRIFGAALVVIGVLLMRR
jgi:bacterial/archaeal transporter family-2 protein